MRSGRVLSRGDRLDGTIRRSSDFRGTVTSRDPAVESIH